MNSDYDIEEVKSGLADELRVDPEQIFQIK